MKSGHLEGWFTLFLIIIIIICLSFDSILYLIWRDEGWAKLNAHTVYYISYGKFRFSELRGPFVAYYILVSFVISVIP